MQTSRFSLIKRTAIAAALLTLGACASTSGGSSGGGAGAALTSLPAAARTVFVDTRG
ncbi:MAG: hypothetical protein ACI80K_004258, partial [Paracoccaceae bacterium]